jgi:hypothetical protein
VSEALGRGLAAELRTAGQPLAHSPLLTFTPNEPALNLYTVGGDFAPHRDLQVLTVLIPLVSGEAFEGGGTGFWRALPSADGEVRGPGGVERDTSVPPALVVTPPRGTALLWTGDVTHNGQAVIAGERTVLVASVSRQQSDSN